jgi:hypothetical protein
MGGPPAGRYLSCSRFSPLVMHGLKPVFLGLSLALVVVGLAYAALGARGLARAESGAGVLLGLGLAAALVGAIVWRVIGRMSGGA